MSDFKPVCPLSILHKIRPNEAQKPRLSSNTYDIVSFNDDGRFQFGVNFK